MASVTKLSRILKKSAVLNGCLPITATRYASSGSPYLRDWKPGPIPASPSERAAAGKKYGLRPEDYKTLSDDGSEWGDYPDVSYRPMMDRDDFYAWDFPDKRRDFGDPVDVRQDGSYFWLYQDYQQTYDSPISWTRNITRWLGLLGFIWCLHVGYRRYIIGTVIAHPIAIKQYPNMGEVHYTFRKPGEEPADHH